MRLCSIASGSSGNCIYIGDDTTHLLVDTGISKKRIEEGLKELEIKGDELQGILITHEHVDHIQGLGVFSRKYAVPVYATHGTIEGIKANKNIGRLPEGLLHEVQVDQTFCLGDMDIRPFAISHDANEPSGYRIENGSKSAAGAEAVFSYRIHMELNRDLIFFHCTDQKQRVLHRNRLVCIGMPDKCRRCVLCDLFFQ